MARRFIFGGSYTSFAFEPETIAYMNALGIANDSTIYYPSTPQQITGNGLWVAVNNFFSESKPKSWYSKCNSIHPYIGGTADRHKFNAKNPLDTDGAFRETFIGGWTHNELGIIGNGINSYTNTHYVPSVQQNINGGGFAIYNRTNNAGTYYDIASNNNGELLVLKWVDNNIYINAGAGGYGYNPIPNTDPRGLWVVDWVSTNVRAYRNGVLFQNRIKSVTPLQSSLYEVGRAPGANTNYSNRNYCFRAMFTSDLTPTEQSDFRTAVQNLQIALNRAV